MADIIPAGGGGVVIAGGAGIIPAFQNSVTINHGLSITPSWATASPSNNAAVAVVVIT